MTPNDPKYPQFWGRMTSDDLENHFLLITGSRASFWYIICLGLKMFGFWPQMTPNTPMSPRPQISKIKNLYLVLSLNLSYRKHWLIIYVTRYLKISLNRKFPIKPKVGRIFKKCVGTFDFFDPRNPSAKFQRKRFVKNTQLGNFADEIGVDIFRVRLLPGLVRFWIWSSSWTVVFWYFL